MKLLKSLDINDLVFLDIESVPLVEELKEGTPLWDSWEYKVRHNRDGNMFEGTLNESYIKKAALFAEFAKIVSIVIGKIKGDKIRLVSYTSHNEAELLNNFCKDLNNITAANKNTRLAGHAVIGFDLPFIMRRCIVNGIELPNLIDIGDEKPWTLTAIDTLNLWKATGFNGSSLINIATALGIPSPKDEMEGEDTYTYYYKVKDGLSLIERYCKKDVACVANVIRKFRYEPIVTVDDTAAVKVERTPLVEKVFNARQTKDIAKLTQKVNSLATEQEVAAGNLILKAATSGK